MTYDPELPNGFQDADFDQRDLEEAGRDFSRRHRRMRALRAAGRLVDAAAACPHGGGYPLNSNAARDVSDPRAGEIGFRCEDCGSVLASYERGAAVLVPCELAPCCGR